MDQTTITVGQRRRLSLSLYLNYVVHGFGLLILAHNMTNLASSWGVTIKMVSFIHNWREYPHFDKWGMNRLLKAR